MNKVLGSKVHWRIVVVFDWKTAAVISISILIRLLMK